MWLVLGGSSSFRWCKYLMLYLYSLAEHPGYTCTVSRSMLLHQVQLWGQTHPGAWTFIYAVQVPGHSFMLYRCLDIYLCCTCAWTFIYAVQVPGHLFMLYSILRLLVSRKMQHTPHRAANQGGAAQYDNLSIEIL